MPFRTTAWAHTTKAADVPECACNEQGHHPEVPINSEARRRRPHSRAARLKREREHGLEPAIEGQCADRMICAVGLVRGSVEWALGTHGGAYRRPPQPTDRTVRSV